MGHLRCLTRCLWAENKVTGTEHSAECWAQSTPEPWGSELWPPAYPRAAWRVYGQVIRRDQGLQSCLNTFYGQCHKKATRTHKKSKESISANFSKPCQMRSKSFGVLALLSQWETDILYFPLKLKLIKTLTFFGLPWWLKRIHLLCRRRRFDSWVRRIPWRKQWVPTPWFLPGKSHRQRSLTGYSPQGHKESDRT